MNLSNATGDTFSPGCDRKPQGNGGILYIPTNSPNGISISTNGKFEWRGDNYEGITPLFAALVCSNTTRQHIIKTLILLDFYMVNSLRSTMSSTNTRSQKIDVLELNGATYILEDTIVTDKENRTKYGLACWKQAMLLRQEEPALYPRLPSTIQSKSFFKTPQNLLR